MTQPPDPQWMQEARDKCITASKAHHRSLCTHICLHTDLPKALAMCRTLAAGIQAVLDCEVCIDEHGGSYLKVPASSMLDPAAGLRGLLQAYETGEAPEPGKEPTP